MRFSDPSPADEEESYLDQPVELDSFDDEGNDDAEASDLVVGEEIDLLGESVGDNDPIELDLGSFVELDDTRADAADDKDAGFEVDPAIGLALPDALTPDDGSEGLDDGAIVVDESKFPSLEQDDGSEGIAAERAISLGTASDEARLPMAAAPWLTRLPVASLEACNALASAPASVVAGSTDLLWFRSDSPAPLRLALDGSGLSDVVLLGADQDIALAITQGAQLFRRARFASQAEQLTRFREPLKVAPGARTPLGFGGSLGTLGGRVLLWARTGGVVEVLDSGDRFERLELDGKVLAVARESATLLIARGRERVLVSLDRTPSSPQTPLTAGSARVVALSDAPLLATSGDAVALAEHGRALLVSSDRGATFRRVAGSASTTAIAGAELAGSARFFAALYRETSDQSEILLIDPVLGEAAIIARLDASSERSPADAIDRGEWAKVSRLSYHAASGRLWAAGGFGVLSFGPTELA
ncbi:MAG: hypothetical protein ABW061_03810 [Polyangiaceae bacterium]